MTIVRTIAMTAGLCLIWGMPFQIDQADAKQFSCEGYWPDAEDCVTLGTELPSSKASTSKNAYCPQWRIEDKWTGKDAFLLKLTDMENVAKHADKTLGFPAKRENLEKCGLGKVPWLNIMRYRGIAWSRMEDGKFVGSGEFADANGKGSMCWPDGYSWHYISKYEVKPSQAFRDYVQAFDVVAFNNSVSKAAACKDLKPSWAL
eukprot:gnl/TRDRNA2_/TRDRNA2_57605_c0_seq1.p1 gnl/TRDRNA2_/TRDRNA2_57605_c0~~gnl/TRDRNA2_/TRDRNA2_57605_c0_seq1.p1  ORF type:complete len:203 (-),score=38.82 gnl/TRDRNA2_/TRDRNA2_57605_c0_seq1:114-722(-)